MRTNIIALIAIFAITITLSSCGTSSEEKSQQKENSAKIIPQTVPVKAVLEEKTKANEQVSSVSGGGEPIADEHIAAVEKAAHAVTDYVKQNKDVINSDPLVREKIKDLAKTAREAANAARANQYSVDNQLDPYQEMQFSSPNWPFDQ